MADNDDSDKKDFKPFDAEQRRKLEEKVKAATQARKAQTERGAADGNVAKTTHLQSTEPASNPSADTRRGSSDDAATETAPAHDSSPDSIELEALRKRTGYHAIGEDERANIEKRVAEKLKNKARLDEFRKHLLSMAGKQVRLDDANPFNKLIMARGQAWNSFDVNLIAGPEMTTHRSVARLWEGSPDFYKIAVGYALDAAGTWRSHAWLIVKNEVNEVTMKFAVYYGVPLTKTESIRFLEWVRSGK